MLSMRFGLCWTPEKRTDHESGPHLGRFFVRGISMELFYEGVNITKDVQISSAKGRDVSGGRSDSLEIVLEDALSWYRWKPQADDRIELVHDGYSTGVLFLNAVAPEGDTYRIFATSARAAARRKANASFENKTLESIMKLCAAQSEMEHRIFGLDRRTFYPYLQRMDEGSAAFLSRIAQWEGAVLKTYSGRFTMIGVLAAQALPAMETVNLTTKQEGISYQRLDNGRLKTLTVKTPYACVTAEDTRTVRGEDRTVCCLPARDPAAAGRWARGMLLSLNRKTEQLTIDSTFRSGWTAMGRIDVTGDTEANGNWMIDEVTHDFVNGTSSATLFRCVETVI